MSPRVWMSISLLMLHRALSACHGDSNPVASVCVQGGARDDLPGHWAPMSLMFYADGTFPAHDQGGAFIAFHGSWNRAPRPRAVFRVVFVPSAGGQPPGTYETFADGFAGSGSI
jgi:glucose/arabinose dehydrogenase